MWTSRSVVRSSDLGCLISGFCSSGRGFAPRFLQTPPRGDALALRSHFTSIRLCRGLAPPGCRTCSAHNWAGRVGEIRVGDGPDPVISVQIVGVDTEAILEKARVYDNA